MTRPNVKDIESQLREDEGEVLHEYKDSQGFSTIGIGVLIDQRKGGGITTEESSYLFNNRLTAKRNDLSRRWPTFSKLDPVRQGVLLNMAYQMGVDGLLAFKKALAAVSVGNYAEAATEMLDSKWATKDSPNRAKRLAEQMRTGVWQ